MTRLQIILLAILGISFIFFVLLFGIVNSYNIIAKLNSQTINQWSEFEKVYQPRFEVIQRVARKVSELEPQEPLNTEIKKKIDSYAQARSIEARVEALIEMEIAVRELQLSINSKESLQKNNDLSTLLNSLQKTEVLIVPKLREYNSVTVNYNRLIRRPFFNLLSAYFNFNFRPVLPLLWKEGA